MCICLAAPGFNGDKLNAKSNKHVLINNVLTKTVNNLAKKFFHKLRFRYISRPENFTEMLNNRTFSFLQKITIAIYISLLALHYLHVITLPTYLNDQSRLTDLKCQM